MNEQMDPNQVDGCIQDVEKLRNSVPDTSLATFDNLVSGAKLLNACHRLWDAGKNLYQYFNKKKHHSA